MTYRSLPLLVAAGFSLVFTQACATSGQAKAPAATMLTAGEFPVMPSNMMTPEEVDAIRASNLRSMPNLPLYLETSAEGERASLSAQGDEGMVTEFMPLPEARR